MLVHSFLHIPDIDADAEETLWSEGVTTWEQLAASQPGIEAIEQSIARLEARDAIHFSSAMPGYESWRLYRDFLEEAVFLDIETTGLGGDSYTTVCGTLDMDGFHAFVRGETLDDLPEYLSQFKLVVTFNGRAFDVPFLRREFGSDILEHAAHMDLMHVLRRLGLKGGLKKIEKAMGVGRPSALDTLDGRDAVSLWKMSQEGEPEALDTLVRYNAEDVLVLPRLAALAVRDHSVGTPMAAYGEIEYPEHDISGMPFDASLVYHLASLRGKTAHAYAD